MHEMAGRSYSGCEGCQGEAARRGEDWSVQREPADKPARAPGVAGAQQSGRGLLGAGLEDPGPEPDGQRSFIPTLHWALLGELPLN